ncbi:EGF domain-containing protein [Trichostrongylus colubriformis]|uniref:EGF domain-containing protein n=1 Tax=Trichostrongylus colubriformis TaxID=6319 RepID=A0AAN8EWZ9_TRICO
MGHVAFHAVTYQSILIVFLELLESCLATEHVIQLRDPPASAVLISVPVNSSVTLRCEKPSNLPELQWLHNGNDLNLKVVRLSGDDLSSIHIERYITKHHDGVYECYAGTASASIRLRGEDIVILPPGFRFCHKSENTACDHARACMADGTGKTSCVCYPGWSGESCNLPQDIQKANLINVPVCPYWPPVITLMVFIFCVFILLVCVYKFKNRPPNKSFRYRGSK